MIYYYTTPDKVRRKLNITEDDVPDEDITPYIITAQKDMLKDISYGTIDDLLSPLNGTVYVGSKTFIADINYDATVNGTDVTVYGWTDGNDPLTKETLTVTRVLDRNGRFVISPAPTSYQKLTADYRYYSKPIDFEQVDEACAILAAYYYASAEIVLMPDQWMHGAYRFQKSQDIDRLIPLYWNKVYGIRGVAHESAEGKDAELERGSS
jgi:hypothetical protein